MTIEEIAKAMTKKEFFDKLNFINGGEEVKGNTILGGFITCPRDCDERLQEDCEIHTKCINCWENAIKNIEFKKEEGNMKELTFKEVIANIKPGEKYVCTDEGFAVKSIQLELDGTYILTKNDESKSLYVNRAKFIKERKPVLFLNAIKAYEEGKTIRCEIAKDYEGVCNKYKRDDDRNCGGYNIINLSGVPIGTREILEGKWYIEEE